MAPTVFKNIRLFDGEAIYPSATVVVSDGIIKSVSTSGSAGSPGADATVIEGANLTLLPGLIESHMHAHTHEGRSSEILRPALKCGITTCCDMHNEPDVAAQIKADAKDATDLPDLKSAFFGATIDGGWPKPIVLMLDPSEKNKARVAKWPSITPETAEDFVIENKRLGADYIKMMQENGAGMNFPKHIPAATVELQTAVVKAAHKHGLLAVAHANNLEDTIIVLKAGCDGLTHSSVDQPPSEEAVELYKKTGAFLIPTLVVNASLSGEEQALRDKYAAEAEKRGLWMHEHGEGDKGCMCGALSMGAKHAKIENSYESVRVLRKAGIDIVAGTDSVAGLLGTAIGPSMWMELHLYVDKCGMTPTEALASATGVAARRMKFHDRGMVKEGLRADLLLVKGDPTADIAALMDVEGVWKKGTRAV